MIGNYLVIKYILSLLGIDTISFVLSYVASTLPIGLLFLIMVGIGECKMGFHREGLYIIIPSIILVMGYFMTYSLGGIY